jgi:hypothetical protein
MASVTTSLSEKEASEPGSLLDGYDWQKSSTMT